MTVVSSFVLIPAVPLLLVLGLIYTLAVHLLLGLGFRGLLRHWLLALAGMAVAYLLALRANSHLPTLGDAHVIEASIGALVVLLAVGLRARLSSSLA